MPYAEFYCVHLLDNSVQFEKILREAGTERGWVEGEYTLSIRYVPNESHPMASTRGGLFICPG